MYVKLDMLNMGTSTFWIIFVFFLTTTSGLRFSRRSKRSFLKPPLINVAFGRKMTASDTCGTNGEVEFCAEERRRLKCYKCNKKDREAHPIQLANDGNRNSFWSSATFFEKQEPVFLELDFKKKYVFLYVDIKFPYFRPSSFSISKKSSYSSSEKWTPFHLFSENCPTKVNKVKCTDIRESMKNVHISATANELRKYVKDSLMFTALKINLDKLATFGDELLEKEVKKDPRIVKKYFFAISDIQIAAFCMCNGHASKCDKDSNGIDQCICEHNTAGKDCEKCLPLFNSYPWNAADDIDSNKCKACNCNNLADECVFNTTLWKTSEYEEGGQCIGCRENTHGQHCHICNEGFYREGVNKPCVPCNCDQVGSYSKKCDSNGECNCKLGVHGKKCEQCQPGYSNLNVKGCVSDSSEDSNLDI